MSGWIKRLALTYILRRLFTVKILEWLQGKKTYIICASAILGAIAAYVSKEIMLKEMIVAIVAALIAASTRAGITKSSPNGN